METLSVKEKGSNVREADESSKVPCGEDQIDVHTRLPLLSDLMEVFSVQFLDFKHHDLEQMYGCILIGAFPTYIVFSRKDGEPLNVDSKRCLAHLNNSKLGEKGKSTLFDRVDGEGFSIEVSPCKDRIAQLPLAKCKTALPYHSSLTVDLNIWQCGNIGEPNKAIIKNAKFEFVAQLSGQETKILRGVACQVNLGVTWSHYMD